MGCFRLFLAVCVVVEHAPLFETVRLLNGDMAVEIFFMLSGFYMTLVLDGKYGANDVSSFYLSRFLRLWPAFLLTTLAYFVLRSGQLISPASGGPILDWAGPWFAWAVRFSNLFMIGQDVPSLFHVSEASGPRLTFGLPYALPDGALWAGYARPIGPAWSIGTEIWFYLLAPFLLRARTATLVAVAVAGLALRFYMEGVRDLLAYYFFPAQLPLFLAGSLAHRASKLQLIERHRLILFALLAGVAVFILATVIGRIAPWHKWLLYALVALALPSLFATTKDSIADRTVGELSYPVYIVHALVIGVAALALKRWHMRVTGEIALLLVVPIAYGLYRFVERPVDRWRQDLVQRRKRAQRIERGQPA